MVLGEPLSGSLEFLARALLLLVLLEDECVIDGDGTVAMQGG